MLLEACIERTTGKIVRVAPPMMLNWTAKERDGKNLCVVKMDREIFRPRGQEELLVDRLDKHWVTYPGELLLRDRAVRARKTLLGRDLTEVEYEAVEASVKSTPLWRIDPKHIKPNAALYLEHLTAETPVPVFDVRMMATATGTALSELSAAGTRDYNGHDTWWASVKTSTDTAQHAEDYNEGAGDLSSATISGASYTPTATYYTRIYPATGHRHDGTLASAGSYIAVANGAASMDIETDYTRLEGLRCAIADGNSTTHGLRLDGGIDNGVIDGCLVTMATGAGTGTRVGINVLGLSLSSGETNTIQNCLVYGKGGSSARQYGIVLANQTEGTTHNINAHNNTVRGTGTFDAGSIFRSCNYRVYTRDDTGIAAVSSKNNISGGDSRAGFEAQYVISDGSSITQTYCLSIDATADDWGGTGNLINQTAANVFVNVASDLRLKDKTSPAWRAGVAVAGNVYDAVGNPWPGPPSMGALELFDAGFFFRHYVAGK